MWGTHISNVMMAYTNKVKELCVQGEHYTLDQVMDIYIYIYTWVAQATWATEETTWRSNLEREYTMKCLNTWY